MRRAVVVRVGIAVALLAPAAVAASAVAALAPTPTSVANRDVAPVVITGAQLPRWSRSPAEGAAQTYPSGAGDPSEGSLPVLKGERTAHNGRLVVPPDARKGVNVDWIAGYQWS